MRKIFWSSFNLLIVHISVGEIFAVEKIRVKES